MRKYFAISFFLLVIIVSLTVNILLNPISIPQKKISNLNISQGTVKPPEHSKEELYQDIIMELLGPYIDKAIYDYYGANYAHDPWAVKILMIKREKQENVFEMLIEIAPYVLAHNAVGVDNISLMISPHKIYVKSFNHIKHYGIPPRLYKEAIYLDLASYKASRSPKEDLYEDIIMTILSPRIDETIMMFYGENYEYYLWDMEIERPNGYRKFYFKIKITLAYTNTALGKDKITFSINSKPEVIEIEYQEKRID